MSEYYENLIVILRVTNYYLYVEIKRRNNYVNSRRN